MLAGGHNVPTATALDDHGPGAGTQVQTTGDKRYYVDPKTAILPSTHWISPRRRRDEDADRGAGPGDHPLFAQAKLRGIKLSPATLRPRCHQRRERRTSVLVLHGRGKPRSGRGRSAEFSK